MQLLRNFPRGKGKEHLEKGKTAPDSLVRKREKPTLAAVASPSNRHFEKGAKKDGDGARPLENDRPTFPGKLPSISWGREKGLSTVERKERKARMNEEKEFPAEDS